MKARNVSCSVVKIRENTFDIHHQQPLTVAQLASFIAHTIIDFKQFYDAFNKPIEMYSSIVVGLLTVYDYGPEV